MNYNKCNCDCCCKQTQSFPPVFACHGADEEDITGVSGVLKFKNKKHNEDEYSGLGRIYLRKNINKDGVNVLTQKMINESNTIYVVQYNYDLDGQTLTIPEGCTLDFQGGSFSNGTIVDNNTAIEAGSTKIFNIDITVKGDWNVERGNVRWFGAKGDSTTDDTLAIQKTIDSFCIIYIPAGKYIISSTLNFNKNYSLINYYDKPSFIEEVSIKIEGESKTDSIIINASSGYAIILDGNNENTSTTSTLLGQSNNRISNVKIIGNGNNNGCCFNSINGLILDNVHFRGLNKAVYFDGSNPPDAGTTMKINIRNCEFLHCKTGIESIISRISIASISSCDFRNIYNWAINVSAVLFTINDCSISSCGNSELYDSGGIKITTPQNKSLNRALTINGCLFEANKWQDILLENIHGGEISSCTFHPYYSIPTGVNNEQICINIKGEKLAPKLSGDSYGVRAINIATCRMQPPSIPEGEINRFLKVTGYSDRVCLDSVSLIIDSQFDNYLYVEGNSFVTNFKNNAFKPIISLSLDSTGLGNLFGDNSIVYQRELSNNMNIDLDLSSGKDGAGVVKGSVLNENKVFVAPYDGYYKVSVSATFNDSNNKVKRVVIESASRKIAESTSNYIVNDSILFARKGAQITAYIQVLGAGKDVSFSDNNPFNMTIEAI